MQLEIGLMSRRDLDELMRLEKECFTCPWTRSMYERELEKFDACYLTARAGGYLVGYAGILILLEEAHIMTMAVRGAYRRRGVAIRILLEMASRAEAMGARFITLEVRESNHAAIELYKKFGFQIMGERRNYYMDNFEDALIMWTEDITGPEYRLLIGSLWEECPHG